LSGSQLVWQLMASINLSGIYTGKISAEICAENCVSKTVYKIIKIKFHIKTLELGQFSAQMSALILPI
jgi:hypothetical protein